MSDETQGTASLPAEGSEPVNLDAGTQQGQIGQQQAPEGEQAAGQAGERPEGETTEQTERKKLSGAQKAKRRETFLLNQLAERDRELEEARQASQRTQGQGTDVDGPPKEEDFNGDWGAYIAARAAYEAGNAVEKRLTARESKDQNVRQVAQLRERVTEHEDRCDEARETIADFDQVLKSASNIKIREDLAREVLFSDQSALLQYHLAKNQDLLHELNGMSGQELARRIGRLEATLKMPAAKQQTTAPPPLGRLSGGAGPAIDLAKADMDTYIAERKKQGFSFRER